VRLLGGVARAGRFALTVRLLSRAHKAAAATLFDELSAALTAGGGAEAAAAGAADVAELARVRALYGV
jgi:hypothetical protein